MKRKKGSDLPGDGAELLPGRALRVFRSARDASQEHLARALGRGDNYVSRLEKGMVERPLFEEVAELLGSPGAAIDWTADYLERLDGTALALGEGDPEDRQDRIIAAELGRWIEALAYAALRRLRRTMDQEEDERRARILLERLRWRAQASRMAMVRESAEYHSRYLVLRLCEESLAATADSADRAHEWAELAVLAAGLLPGDAKERARVQGYATVHLANAQRVKGELRAADRTYGEGRRLWDQGSGDGSEALNEARVLGFGASLRRAQRQFKEALELLDRALKVDRGEEAPYLLLNKAKLLRESGDLEGAVEVLKRAEPVLTRSGTSRLLFIARLNFVDHLSVLGLFDEASRRLPAVWLLTSDHAGELDRVRLIWVEGRVAAGTGREAEGIASLEQVWREFHHRGMAYDSALTALELAALHLRMGETAKVKALARQIKPVFESQEVHREALAALAIFCQAAEQEHATVGFLERLVRYLHRARHNPELHFEPTES